MNENEDMQMIPYYVHESDMARMERQIKRLWIVLIMTIVFLVGSNAAWIYYESQFVDEVWTSEATTDGGGTAVANMDGEVYYYGEGENNSPQKNP